MHRYLVTVFALASAAVAHGADLEVQAWVDRADRLADRGNYETAIGLYKRALVRDGNNKELWRKYNRVFHIHYQQSLRRQALEDARRRRVEAQEAARAAAAAEEARKAALAASDGRVSPSAADSTESSPSGGSTSDSSGAEEGPDAVGRDRGAEPAAQEGSAAAEGEAGLTAAEVVVAKKAFEKSAAAAEPEERVFAPSERIYLPEARRAFDKIGSKAAHHDVVVRSGKFEITDIRIGFDSRGLVVRGRLRNTAGHSFSYPRIYVKVFDGGGTMRGRNVGYVKPGRFVLPSKKSKEFEVKFPSYDATVGSYGFEVVTNL